MRSEVTCVVPPLRGEVVRSAAKKKRGSKGRNAGSGPEDVNSLLHEMQRKERGANGAT